MAVLHDWICLAHGKFESFDGRCPHGCDEQFVAKTYVQAPGLRSDRTKNIDNTFRQLAADYGLTDMNNQNGTGAVKRPDPYKEKEQSELIGRLGDTSHLWGQLPSGQGGISQALAANRVAGENALSAILPSLHQPVPQVVGRYDAPIDKGAAA